MIACHPLASNGPTAGCQASCSRGRDGIGRGDAAAAQQRALGWCQQRVRRVDWTMSQYSLVRSWDFCRYGQASHSLRLSPRSATIGQAPHRLPSVRGRPICKPGRTAHGLGGSMVIYCRQAKQIPSADAFPRKPSPSSLSQSARTDEFSSASAQAGSPRSTSRLDRRGGSRAFTRGAQLVRTGIAGCRRASIEGKKLIRH